MHSEITSSRKVFYIGRDCFDMRHNTRKSPAYRLDRGLWSPYRDRPFDLAEAFWRDIICKN